MAHLAPDLPQDSLINDRDRHPAAEVMPLAMATVAVLAHGTMGGVEAAVSPAAAALGARLHPQSPKEASAALVVHQPALPLQRFMWQGLPGM